jgi:hypothetical protein
MSDKLDKMAETAKKEKWDKYIMQNKLSELQKSLRINLKNGVVP